MRLLLVEDNVPLADELNALFSRNGYAVDWYTDGRDAANMAVKEPYDVIVLDLGLPGRPGLSLLEEWREAGLDIPILILTARSSWSERITGLRAGADDYLPKPFHPDELILRLQALVRRRHGQRPSPTLNVGGVTLDENSQTAIRDSNGTPVSLTRAEFAIMRYLMHHPEHVISKDRLLDHLYDSEHERNPNVVEVHINHLRQKLGRGIIVTQRGQGYRFGGDTTP
ncbi:MULTISPECIES: response regulator transcription factor [Larsenimonas]|uniref:Response regulator transcription factor n=1 Tax=Larsenimonas suaedae TaxID=1851019 RepID=A0ABU1GX15_9GAMM|nr:MULTISPECIES: response regulator transcription factor [Larsenimonas]MCM2973154.1 response regulator transcription factor [Larsenimonas suaedae]MCM5705571.1 response regulator transcription factor [Larsenimonas salina]MDR5896591.1 response regulator transcription factor [Larsenimonas suaedae]